MGRENVALHSFEDRKKVIASQKEDEHLAGKTMGTYLVWLVAYLVKEVVCGWFLRFLDLALKVGVRLRLR